MSKPSKLSHPPNLATIQASHYDPAVIRRLFEARSAGRSRSQANGPLKGLHHTLVELESVLDSLSDDSSSKGICA